jgi:hypothetical protein
VGRFIEDVARAAAVDLTKSVVYIVAGSLGGLFALLVWQGGSVPTWTLVLTFVAAILAGFALRVRALRRLRGEVQDVESERDVLDEEAGIYSAALERHESYSGHVAQALDALQRMVSGDIDIPIPRYIEAGIREPARDLINDNSPGTVRLSVLLPRDGTDRWSMPWAAGHTITGKAKYDQRIVDTLSRRVAQHARIVVIACPAGGRCARCVQRRIV